MPRRPGRACASAEPRRPDREHDIASGPGGGFDLWGRMVARHIGKHLPGRPNVVPQNMPGAGGFVAANHLYNVAPKDGTAMAIMPAGTPLGPIMGASGARFDATRFTWVGTPATETPVCIAFNRERAKVRTVADLYEHELVVGSTGPGAGRTPGRRRSPRCSA